MASDTMNTTAFSNWFGTNRAGAERVGAMLAGCTWVGVPFAGSMCEVPHLTARQVLVNDAHRHLINMARVAADPALGPKFYRAVRRLPLHPDAMEECQRRCRLREAAMGATGAQGQSLYPTDDAAIDLADRLGWAVDYFACNWMGQGSKSGKRDEFDQGVSFRWKAGGGGSAVRYQSAASALVAWRRVFRRCEFTCMDAFAFIEQAAEGTRDNPANGIYCDPPFPGPGDAYKHTFGVEGQRRLARLLSAFKQTRIVARFYDHELVRELYPEGEWSWVRWEGRKQSNAAAPEVLLVRNRPAATERAA